MDIQESALEAAARSEAALPVVTRRWGIRHAGRLAWTMWALSTVLVAIALVLPYTTDFSTFKNQLVVNIVGYPTVVVYATVGAFVAARRPGNPFGWICCIAALLIAGGAFAESYTRYAVLTRPGALPAGPGIAWFVRWPTSLGLFSLFTIAPLRFPDGRLPSRRWLPIGWLTVGALVMATILDAFRPGAVTDQLMVDNPLGNVDLIGITGLIYDPVVNFTMVICLVSVLARFRSAKGDERQQIKWFAYATLLAILFFGARVSLTFLDMSQLSRDAIDDALLVFSIAVFPIGAGIAILKYRLYDIDVLINRTLVYIPLTGILTGIYSASIALFQRLFIGVTGQKSDAAIVLTTLVLASSFTPLKNGLQVVVDKRFKETHDPTKTLRLFGDQVRSFVQLSSVEQITGRLMDEVITAFDASGGAIYLGEPEHLQLVHARGEWNSDALMSVPLKAGGEQIGLLSLQARRNGLEYTPSDRKTLHEIVDAVAEAIAVAGRGRKAWDE